MPKQIIIAEQHRIAAVFSEDQIQELVVAKGSHQIGDIYLGLVENVLPGIDAAFVNIGDSERNGFIHVSDLGPLRLRKTMGSITELLAPQQKVLVQIIKEPTGNKGPRLTGNITLPGRYLVLMPYGKGVSLSRRIRNEAERNHLRALAILIKPPGMGLLVRTEADGVSEEAIIEDLEILQKQWESVLQEAGSTRPPALLNRDDDFIQRVLRDVYTSDVNRIVVDSATGLKRVKHYLGNWNAGKLPAGVLVDQHGASETGGRDQRGSILEYFRINAAIREALRPRVDLPSGGYIIIEPTEALTVIDVNSGSSTGYATARETVLWTNCEAAVEIARQLRLRNIAGVIIVDFIDMDSRRDQLQALEQFNKALRADKARPQIAQLSELGLVELTRKRQGQNIYELFGRNCPSCGGLGHLVHLPGEADDQIGEMIDRSSLLGRDYGASDSSGEGRSRSDGHSRRRRPPRGQDHAPSPLAEPAAKSQPWVAPGDDFDTDPDDPQHLELLNHPNYQERSDPNNRRRRRRRVGNGSKSAGWEGKRELPTQESGSEYGAPEGAVGRIASPKLANGREARGASKARVIPEGLVANEEEMPIETRELDLGRSERSERVERGERGERGERRSRRGDGVRVPAPPPELVSVAMTYEEQDVYAFMGVSPLALSTQEVRDPRSAIVSVVLPGEEVPISLPVIVKAEDENFSEEPISYEEVPVLPNVELTTPPEPEEPSFPEASETSETSEGSEGNGSDLGRRRRRRSSASDS